MSALRHLQARVDELVAKKGWRHHWTERGAYLHLEASELIEAIRGKGGDPADEGGDVLITLMALLTVGDVHADQALAAAHRKLDAKLSELTA